MRVAIGVEYDGTHYHGWQAQQEVNSVQAELEKALSHVANHPVKVVVSGRTDAGVHGLEQVAHFDTQCVRPDYSWVLGANAELPSDIRVLWSKPVTEAFHARFSALERHYQYRIYNRPVRSSIMRDHTTWCYHLLDEQKMQEAAQHLIGEHNFNAYRATGCQAKSPVRTITELSVCREQDLVLIDVRANAFLHHMVRNIAGVLIEIGKGRRHPEWSKAVLESQDRTQGGITAEPQGLYLVDIRYP